MTDKPQQPASDEPKQTTPKGLEIPVPKRRDLMDAFRKIVGAPPKKPKPSVQRRLRSGRGTSVPVLAAVVAPRPLVQVALQPLVRDGVMSATDACLEQAEEPVDGLCM